MEEKNTNNKANRRRRERAQKIRNAKEEEEEEDDDSCDEGIPLIRSKPPRPRKKTKEPLFEEELIDGFSIFAFKSYDDLEVIYAQQSANNICFVYAFLNYS